VVLSDGQNNAGCQPVLQAAGQAKSQGILMMTVCVGSDCDAACMRQAASSARYFFQIDNAGGLATAFAKIRDEVLNVNLKRLTVTDVLPPNMQYVTDSAQPAPNKGDPTTGFTWQANYVPRDGITITFKVRPLETGYHPTNVQAVGELLDNQNRSKDFDFPLPHVTVLQPFPLATVTLPPPTPTYTPTPTPTNTPPFTPTPTNTPTPTPTPTRVPGPIYLPILLREACERQYVFADIVLVLDVSTSMDRPTREGRSKMSAAIAAAQDFVSVVDLTPDEQGRHSQMAVVGFNREAWTEIGLSKDRAALDRALANLPKRRQTFTRLDLAFEQGQKTLFGPGRIETNTPVIVLLTDGLPEMVPVGPDGTKQSTVRLAAQRAKDAGARVYTIGIGAPTDIDPQLLADCASAPGDYYYQADAEDLSHIYNEIAFSFGCLGGKHDWSQPWK
jgi:Mg-chelatase subunit ChlD